MSDLVITNTLESREVAEMVGMRHADLLRSIEGYIDVISQNAKLRSDTFFIESTYTAGTGRAYKCYKLTKMGCEMVANKLTGEKGILFTAEYVKRFNDMEKPMTQIELIAAQANALVEQERRTKQLEADMKQVQETQRIQNARLDVLNGVCIDGTPRQKLKAMVDCYSHKNGLQYRVGWLLFKTKYNTAFSENLQLQITNYEKAQGKKKVTIPEYLEAAGKINDALRVAEKMLNSNENED